MKLCENCLPLIFSFILSFSVSKIKLKSYHLEVIRYSMNRTEHQFQGVAK